MKVKILRTTVASGYRVESGKNYDLSDYDADLLIRMGKAEIYTPPTKSAPKKKVSDDE